MTWSLVAALGAVLGYGIGSVLQAVGARRTAAAPNVHPRLLAKLALQLPFMSGLGLDAVGVACTIVALRHLPLFVVQAAVASSVAVTALLAGRVFRTRLSRVEAGGIAVIVVGLVLLAVSAGPESPPSTSLALRAGLLAAAGGVVLAGAWTGRLSGPRSAPVLGALAGLAFGIGNTAIRVTTDLAPAALVRNPAAWAALVCALTGVLLFAVALQRGSVTSASGLMVAAETLLPAGFGLLVLHEAPRRGLAAVAVLGFLLTIGGALTLSRFGAVDAPV
ncbi:MAG: integral rane protein [Acidimicrobiales bacterium]|nr:integral rane protein [Acidimicrobiales bacterium]